MTEKAENVETKKVHGKRSMCRILACSFKRSFSIIKSRDELTAESETSAENNEEQREEEQTAEETESLHDNTAESDIQGELSSQSSLLTEEEKVLSEEKVESQASGIPVTPEDYKKLNYKPATVPQRNRFQAGVTFVDSQGYVYAQEVKEGKRASVK